MKFRRDPANETLWTVENDCGVPVAIVLSLCDRSADACDRDAAWQRAREIMLLPAKAQRSVTEAENTVVAAQLRHAACEITSQSAIELLNVDRDARTAEWRERFASASQQDECLAGVSGGP